MNNEINCSCHLHDALEDLIIEVRELATEENEEPIDIAKAIYEIVNDVMETNHNLVAKIRCLKSLLHLQEIDSD